MAVREILGESGTHFDPQVIEAFARLQHASLVQPYMAARAAIEYAPAVPAPGAGAGSDSAAA